MVRNYCFVPGCKSGYNSDRKSAKVEGKRVCSLFTPPQDVVLFDKWLKAIPRADKVLSKDDRVCELHFQKEDVERFYVTKLPDGTVHKLERGKPVLKSGAIPVIFQYFPAYLSESQHQRKLPASRYPLHKMYQYESKIKTETLHQNTAEMDTKESLKFLKEFEFNSISSESIELPSNLWSITSTADFIIFAKWNRQYTCERRIVIEKDLAVKIYIQTRTADIVDVIKLTCLQDVNLLLLKVDSFSACAGVDDEAMKNCLAYVHDYRQFGGRLSPWCEECRKVKKREAKRNYRKRNVYCRKKLYQRLVCVKRKASRLQQKVVKLRKEVQILKK